MEESEARQVFEELYRGSYRRLLAYALQRTANSEDAQEVVAETFLVAWRRLDDLIDAENPLAWLYGVAHRMLANQRRRQRRQQKLNEKLAGHTNDILPETAHRDVEGRRLLAEVIEIIDELPPRYQEVLKLTAYQGLSPAEIASVLKMPPVAVRTLLYRARIRLRRLLDERYPGWGLVIEEPE
ncbi:MAG: RNA polymerase sigma factor [Acidimicrobiia bacterium]